VGPRIAASLLGATVLLSAAPLRAQGDTTRDESWPGVDPERSRQAASEVRTRQHGEIQDTKSSDEVMGSIPVSSSNSSNTIFLPILGPSAARAVAGARIGGVITREIQSYVARDWAAARESKDAFWATRIARLGPFEGLRIADELRRQVVRQNPEWPSDEERHNDLAAHTRLSELLRRASRPSSR